MLIQPISHYHQLQLVENFSPSFGVVGFRFQVLGAGVAQKRSCLPRCRLWNLCLWVVVEVLLVEWRFVTVPVITVPWLWILCNLLGNPLPSSRHGRSIQSFTSHQASISQLSLNHLQDNKPRLYVIPVTIQIFPAFSLLATKFWVSWPSVVSFPAQQFFNKQLNYLSSQFRWQN